MRNLKVFFVLSITSCLLACSCSVEETEAPPETESTAAEDQGAVFEDDFEEGEPAEWDEEEEREEGDNGQGEG